MTPSRPARRVFRRSASSAEVSRKAALREAGCVDVYPGPAALFARFDDTRLAK
ncbi:hypothetical protein ABIC09_004984 [Bradyrhizobium sp. S3.12.5]